MSTSQNRRAQRCTSQNRRAPLVHVCFEACRHVYGPSARLHQTCTSPTRLQQTCTRPAPPPPGMLTHPWPKCTSAPDVPTHLPEAGPSAKANVPPWPTSGFRTLPLSHSWGLLPSFFSPHPSSLPLAFSISRLAVQGPWTPFDVHLLWGHTQQARPRHFDVSPRGPRPTQQFSLPGRCPQAPQ